MSDKLVRGTAADKAVSVVFCNMKETCNEAIRLHQLKGGAAEALCKALIGVVLISSTLKNKDDYTTLIIKGTGPIEGITVTADQTGKTKGFLHNKDVQDASVAKLIGTGIFTVAKDIGLREPYVGKLPLVSGEIADDITSYFAESEQIPTSCGISVVFNDDGTIKAAGGFLIQLLPDPPYYIVQQLETDLARHPSPSELLLTYGDNYEVILKSLLPALNPVILSETDIEWFCNCSSEKISRAIATLSQEDIDDILKKGKDTEVICDFCNKIYNFTPEEVVKIVEENK